MQTPRPDTDPELEDFKTKINLSEFAASKGFKLDKERSKSCSISMNNGSDVVVITRATNGHWIYFSVQSSKGDSKDGGSIIDFIHARYSLNLGQIRKHLRPWLGFKKRPKINPTSFARNIKALKKTDIDLLEQYHKLKSIEETNVVKKYLVKHRYFTEDIFSNPRFAGTIKSDRYNNAIFPHWYYSKVVGWEIKNLKFTGFPPHSTKSIWFTNRFDKDNTLVISESAIDLISFFSLFPEHISSSWGISTAGSWGPMGEEMLEYAIKIIPGQTIIAAFDNDEAGQYFSSRIEEIVLKDSPGSPFSISVPITNDWNRDLENKFTKLS